MAWALLAAGGWAATRPWQQSAEASAANLLLAGLSLLLPAAALWQATGAWLQRPSVGRWRLQAQAGLSLLALCSLVAGFGLLPVVAWRW